MSNCGPAKRHHEVTANRNAPTGDVMTVVRPRAWRWLESP